MVKRTQGEIQSLESQNSSEKKQKAYNIPVDSNGVGSRRRSSFGSVVLADSEASVSSQRSRRSLKRASGSSCSIKEHSGRRVSASSVSSSSAGSSGWSSGSGNSSSSISSDGSSLLDSEVVYSSRKHPIMRSRAPNSRVSIPPSRKQTIVPSYTFNGGMPVQPDLVELRALYKKSLDYARNDPKLSRVKNFEEKIRLGFEKTAQKKLGVSLGL